MKGRIVKYDTYRGFGFIRLDNEPEKYIFVHINEVDGANKLIPGQKVIFKIRNTKKGPVAISVNILSNPHSPYLLYGVISMIIVLIMTIYFSQEMDSIFAYLLSVNFVTFIMYGYDKSIINKKKTRVPEFVLQALAFCGGTPAGYISQKLFNHKIAKKSFQRVFWIIVILQVVVFYFWWSGVLS